jgi:hypothetical protein
MQLIRNHFLALFGYAALFGPPVWKAVKPVLQWLGDFDLIISRIEDPDWMGAVMRFILDPPGWLIVVMMIVGIILIFWDGRRTQEVKQSGGDGFSATGDVSWPPKRSWIQRVEPSHIIILGLVIALGGTIWQWRRVPVLVPDPQIAQLQSQVDSLTKRLAAAATPLPLAKQAEAPALLMPRDVQRLLEALGEAQYLSEKSITPALGAIDSWAVNWRGLLRNGNGEVVYVTGRDTLKRDVWDKIDALLAKYPAYQTQLQAAFALEIPAAKNELSRALEDAIDTVKKYPKNAPPDMDDLMEPRFKELIKQSNLAWNWWAEARQRITEMTANLKSKGTAEYAKR